MKIIIEDLDINELTDKQRAFFSFLGGAQKQTTITAQKSVKVKFPKVYGKTDDTVLQIIHYLGDSATLKEISRQTEIPEASIRNAIFRHTKKGVLAANKDYPKRYYFQSKGDPDLIEALKNVPRRQNNKEV